MNITPMKEEEGEKERERERERESCLCSAFSIFSQQGKGFPNDATRRMDSICFHPREPRLTHSQ